MFWTAFYGTLTALTALVVFLFRYRDLDLMLSMSVLVLFFVLSNIAHTFSHRTYNQYFAVMDGSVAAVMAWVWRGRQQLWKYLLILLFVADVFLHVGYFQMSDTSFAARYNYDLRLNLIYLAQLACVIAGTMPWKRRVLP